MSEFISSIIRFGLVPAALMFVLNCSIRAADIGQKPTPPESSAATLVKKALESELAGQNSRRESLLHEAIKQSPDNSAAHWQLGEIRVAEKNAWLPALQAEIESQKDPLLAQYIKRRNAIGHTLNEQVAMANWCRKNKLSDQERAHWFIVLQMQPNHPEAKKRLEYYSHRDQSLVTEKNARKEEVAQKFLDTTIQWQSLVPDWQKSIESGETSPPSEVLRIASDIADSRKILAWQRYVIQQAGGNKEMLHRWNLALARSLRDNPHPVAAECLTQLAISTPWEDVRNAAGAGLKPHPHDHYVPQLLALLQSPIEVDLNYNVDGNGNLITRAKIYREGPVADLAVSHTLSPKSPPPGLLGLTPVGDTPGDVPVLRSRLGPNATAYLNAHPEIIPPWQKEEKARAAAEITDKPIEEAYKGEILRRQNQMVSQAQAARRSNAIYSQIEPVNREIEKDNALVTSILQQATGMELGDGPANWWKWWWRELNDTYTSSANGAAPEDDPGSYNPETDNPIYQYEYVRQYDGYSPPDPYVAPFQSYGPTQLAGIASCFAPGTKVWSQTGRVAIEKILVGDRVLAQDIETGELAFKVVMAVTIRPPHQRMRIGLGAESITATPGHPFWVDGKAWQLTKQLKEGQILHTLAGGLPIENIELFGVDRTANGYSYNLIVADFNTYFVGEQGILVHDNTPRRPTSMRIPGLPAETTVDNK